MPKKYDAALRERVVGAVDRGMSARAAAARYEVGVATAVRWVRRWHDEGSHADPPRRQRTLKLDAYADWLAGVRVHETTLWYWLRRNGITYKKRL